MSKLIYSCVFFRKDYLDLLNLLLESFSRHGNSTKYLVITNARFQERIEEMFTEHGIDGDIWAIQGVFTQFAACCARLHIFSYPEIDKYTTLLYLDADILITNPLDSIFDIVLEDKLYCQRQEITLKDWGAGTKLFTENKINIDLDRYVFSTGIMLFKNCKRLRTLFTDVLAHIAERISGDYDLNGAFEEDFVIYRCFVEDCYDDIHLTPHVRNDWLVEDKDMIINHFSAKYRPATGTPDGKLEWMHLYLARMGMEKYARTIIHIGTHDGIRTSESDIYYLFNKVAPIDKCILIEPVSYLFKQLKKNYNEAYPGNNFVFINKAVSNTIGSTEMVIPSEKNDFDKLPSWASMIGSLKLDHIELMHDYEEDLISDLITETVTVPITTINQIIKDHAITEIDLLLIDAEGHDFEILTAYDFSILPKVIVFEHCHMGKEKLSLLIYQLQRLGYKETGITSLDIILELSK